MCRNHSHITVENIGHVRVGVRLFAVLEVEHPLAVEWRSGDKWIRPPGSQLLVPYSLQAGLYPLTVQAMEVCYTPAASSEASDTIIMPGARQRRRNVGDYGETTSSRTATYHYPTEDGDDDIPW